MKDDKREHISTTTSGLLPGLIVAAIGLVFLLNNLNIVRAHDVWEYWPVILIVVGITKLTDSTDSHEKTGGAIMILVGGLLLSSTLGLLSWSVWQFWPLILIGVGLLMLFNRSGAGLIAGLRFRPSDATSTKADGIAIFGGFKRRVATDDYRGANYVAIFGGGEIDLRRAQIQGDSATIEITAIFGGFEIRVPSNWMVRNEVVGVLGGSADETLQPLPEAPGVKHLIVRGTAFCGGVSVKN
jgi:predicted membrane protein